MPRSRRAFHSCEIDMTPMIDVVFQLIIFFIVTITLTKKYNEEIELEDGPHGVTIDSSMPAQTLTIEIDRRGRLTIHGAGLSYEQLRSIVRNRWNSIGEFPVMIRADKDTRHDFVRAVMNICTEVGLARVAFVAIQERTGVGR